MEIWDVVMKSGDASVIGRAKDIMASALMMTISFVGIFIVGSSLFKNCIHAVYAANTKFWDKVHAVKGQDNIFTSEWGKQRIGSNEQNANFIARGHGWLESVLLNLFPDVKSYTEFEDGSRVEDPKSYFTRAIPAMLIYCFIGVFVFYGYPGKIMQKVSIIGAQVIDMGLMNFNPVQWVESVSKNLTKPAFATDGALDYLSQCQNKMANIVYTEYVGTLTDMTKEKRINVGLQIETWVIENCDKIDFKYFNDDAYDMALEARTYDSLNVNFMGQEVGAEDKVTGVFRQVFTIPYNNDRFDHGSAMNVENKLLAYVVQFTPKASKEETTVSWDNCGLDATFTVSGNSASCNAPVKELHVATSAYGYIAGSTSMVNIYLIDEKLVIQSSNTLTGSETIERIQGVSFNSAAGGRYNIKTIKMAGGETIPTFKNEDGTVEWTTGQEPVEVKKNAETAAESNENTEVTPVPAGSGVIE